METKMPSINQTKFDAMALSALTPLMLHCAITGAAAPAWLRTGYGSLAGPSAIAATPVISTRPATPRTKPATPAARAKANGAAPGGKAKLTADDIRELIAAQPDGIHDTTLRQVLVDTFGARPAVIGTLLARMKKATKDRAALITQRGELWFLKSARQPRAAKDTAVDKTIGERRTRPARGTNGATAGTSAATEAQQQAAGAAE